MAAKKRPLEQATDQADKAQRIKELQGKLEQAFGRLFATDDGKVVKEHLCRQFEVDGRSLIPDGNKAVCPVRGGVRDGERAVVMHILRLTARGLGKKTIEIPVTQ